jgi:addiction module HigA family antidote
MTYLVHIPDWGSPPGDSIIDILEEKGWTQAELAERTEFTRKHIKQLVKGKAPINEETSLKLERVLGNSAGFWLNREAQYKEILARQSELNDLKPFTGWLNELPITEMVRFGWIKKYGEKVRQAAECLRYFGVASKKAWEEKYENVFLAYRASDQLQKQQGSVTAWLRHGEIKAESVLCCPFRKTGLESRLQEMRALTLEEDPGSFLPKLEQLCADAGVALVVAPAPKGCSVSGVTRWPTPDKALIMLSLRYRTNDHFWFTFFHEVAHLILHGKKVLFLELDGETMDDKSETEANQWASNFLIPKSYEGKLKEIPKTELGIKTLSSQLKIAPGIIVGRLQREGILQWSEMNQLKTHFTIVESET